MNTRHPIAAYGLGLLLLALPASASLAQAPADGAFLPDGIEATGDTTEVRALHAWVEEHSQSHPDQAERAARRALGVARDLNDQRWIGQSLSILGRLASDPYQAEALYLEAKEAFEQVGDERNLARNQVNLGIVYQQRGELRQTLNAYFQGLEKFRHLEDELAQLIVLNNIGHIFLEHDGLQEATLYFERALALAERLDHSSMLVNSLGGLAGVLIEQGAYEDAEAHLRRTLTIAEEDGSQFFVAATSSNLGAVLNDQGRYERALPFLFAAEHLIKELGQEQGLPTVYDELGKAHMGLGRYEDALRYSREGLALARETGSFLRQMELHQTLSQVYEETGNLGQALVHQRQYAVARDSVFNAEKAEIVAEMQTRYEAEEKQRANQQLQQEIQIQALRASRRETLLLTGVGGLLLLLGFIFYRYRIKQKANRLLEDLDRAKSRFFANISHEFRTPLTVILGELQDGLVGRSGTLSEKLANRDHVMLRNTRRLQQLINEVLDLSRLEAGKLELHPAPGDLVQSLRQLVEVDAPLAERNGIELIFESDVENCPRLYDDKTLETIVGNLLSNALKFTPKGGMVQVSLRSGKEVEIVVSDTGPGIPEDEQVAVFERFAQLDDGSRHGGTGIGLALVKELAELHGGTIVLKSEPGKGSTFIVRLPLEAVTLTDQTPETGTPLTGELDPPQTEPSLSGWERETEDERSDHTTVLIIEDHADIRAYVRRSLEKTYRVFEAEDGEIGLQQARAELPDLIVSDVMLTTIDGYEVTRQLKAEPSTECIPVVMLTARAGEEDQTEGYSSGAEVYITKPFSPETLRAACSRLIEERMRLRQRLQEEEKRAEKPKPSNGHTTLRERARVVVIENLQDETFNVAELASTVNLTRQTLYNRLQSEVGLSPSDFIRTLRLEQARKLLAGGAGSISEVAYAVGFNSLSVFSRNYRAHYGVPPSDHLDQENTKRRDAK